VITSFCLAMKDLCRERTNEGDFVLAGVFAEESHLLVNALSPEQRVKAVSHPSAVLILGMGRSGTSSVAGALVRLGGTAPRHLMAAAPDNPRGFWESTAVEALNDEILAAGGSEWLDWRRFDVERIDAAQANELRERARATLIGEFGCAGVPIVKDPRMCRLMDFWRPVFNDLAWFPRVVLPIRSPLEVAWSLRRRDRLGVGAGCLLWLRHVLDAEAGSRGMQRAVLDWSRFLDDWPGSLQRVAEQLGLGWMRGDGWKRAEVTDFLSPELRHFKASAAELRADPAVSVLVRETYSALLELVDDPNFAPAQRKLDELRERFDAAAPIFEHAMRDAEEEVRHLQFIRDEAVRRGAEMEHALARANAAIALHAFGAPSRRDRKMRLTARSRAADRRALRMIRASPFFDEAYYLANNPDVRAAGCDAAVHFLVLGCREGRDPGPFFSTMAYLARNPDVAAAGVNALVHYETHGRSEMRPVIG
jgi:hypothetical protein